MMRLARTATLFAVVVLCVSVGTASAECAWVLWQSAVSASYGTWEVISSHVTKKDCDSALAMLVDRWVKQAPSSSRLEAGIAFKADDGTHLLSAYCHPDTMDPRGPKGR